MTKQFIKILGLTTCCLLLLSSLAMAGTIKVWGSTTCQKAFLEPGAADYKAATGDNIKVLGVGTGKGMMALISGKAVIAAVSSPMESAIKSAKKAANKAGKEITIPDNLIFHEMTKDIIVPIIHKDNPVSALSFEQLAKLNTGEITNWKDVGGSDMPVKVVTSHAGSATRAVFQKKVMKKADYIADATIVKSTRLELQNVSKNKGAIGAVSQKFFSLNPGDTKIVKTDEISRPLALITVGTPTPEAQKLIDFFKSSAGQKFFQ